MKKITLLVLFISLFGFHSFSQTVEKCGSDKIENELRIQYPQILIEEQKLQQFVVDWIAANKSSDLRDEQTYIIPVVFHIIHDYGIENITDAQVYDAVRVINEDYQKMNADTSLVIPEFKDIIGNTHVEFRLANKTPGGLCTNGIDRIHSLSTYVGGDNAKLNNYPRNMYLNIWTVKKFGTSFVGVAAYAYQPTTVAIPFLAPYDGVISLSSYVGSIGTSNLSVSHTLTHEIGHTLALSHPWGNTNDPGVECGDDGIDDTPITEGWDHCPSPTTAAVCNPNIVENYQNFMEYSYCDHMFTEGQSLVMRGVLANNAADRSNLWSPANLAATGTDDTTYDVCAPRVDFYSDFKMACAGSPITFHDVSWSGVVESWSWTFQDGTPSTATTKDVIVTFSSPGWKTVTLTVTNSAGTSTETREQSVYISSATAQYGVGYKESFEDPNTFVNDWVVQNLEGNSSSWQYATNAGFYSGKSVRLNNFLNMVGDIDNLITPSFNLSSGGAIYLNFRYSCGSYSTALENIDDLLKIYASSNCGQTWSLLSSIADVTLANAGYYETEYVPTFESPWVSKSLQIPAVQLKPNVRFKFEFTTNGRGNNIYIDEVNIWTHPVGIDDPVVIKSDLSVSPNPMSDESQVVFYNSARGNINLSVFDLAGKRIKVISEGYLSEGPHTFTLTAAELKSPGMFLIVADDGHHLMRTKLVVQ